MKYLPKFLLIPELLLAISLAPFMAMNANAADQNTYRAGSPYLQVHANSAQQCEQQCQGDAQCRGWNFVRRAINMSNGKARNQNTNAGMCEFNARIARPLPSPSSVSGTMSTNIDSLMSQAVAGGTHTVRVGTQSIAAPKPNSLRRSSRRIVKKQPIPKQRVVRPAMHRRVLPAQTNLANQAINPRATNPQISDPRKPRIYGGQKQQATPQQQRQMQQQRQPQQLSEQQRYRQEFLRRRQQSAAPQANRQAAPRMSVQDKAQRHRQAIFRAQRAAALAAPTQPAQRQRPLAQRPQAPRLQRPQRAQRPAPQQQFSYGSLHDDITKNMTTVSRPKTAPDNFGNPDAPISTSRAMPTKPVETRPLTSPVLSGLAGG